MKRVKILAATFAALSGGVYAQSDLTLYNFNAIPQSLHVNPAYPQQTKVWIGLPVLSGVHYHYHNDGFSLRDLIPSESNGITNAQLREISNSLDEKSQIANSFSTELLGVGFKAGKGFVSLGAYQSVDIKMDYPVEVIRFIADETYASQGINIENYQAESVVRTNIYLGYQYKLLEDRLSIGGRVKYVIGQQNTYFEKARLRVDPSDTFNLRVETDILIRSSGLGNLLEDGGFDRAFGDSLSNTLLPPNTGLAFDFGADYKINDKLSVNFSVLDLGSVQWNRNNYDFVSKGSYTYEGANVDFAEEGEGDAFESALDSLEAAFDFEKVASGPYKRRLSSRLFLGANYAFTPKHAVGLLYHRRFWEGQSFNDYSVNYQGRWSRAVQFTVSYSIINRTYNNIGAGIDLKLGPLQLYLLSDNILGAFMYENLQTTNLRAGLNLTFYGKKEKGKKKTADPPVLPAGETEILPDNAE